MPVSGPSTCRGRPPRRAWLLPTNRTFGRRIVHRRIFAWKILRTTQSTSPKVVCGPYAQSIHRISCSLARACCLKTDAGPELLEWRLSKGSSPARISLVTMPGALGIALSDTLILWLIPKSASSLSGSRTKCLGLRSSGLNRRSCRNSYRHHVKLPARSCRRGQPSSCCLSSKHARINLR